MQQITIRGLEPEIEQAIRQIAKKSHKSINQVIKEIIHKAFKPDQPPAASLKNLAGGWSEKDTVEFERSTQFFETIDEEMWK